MSHKLNIRLMTADAVFATWHGGKTAFTLLVGGMPAYLKLMIGVVDARTGELLLYTDPILVGDPTIAVDRLRDALEKGFKKLPAGI